MLLIPSALPRPAGLYKEEVLTSSRDWYRISALMYQLLSSSLSNEFSISSRNFHFCEKPALFFFNYFRAIRVLGGIIYRYWCAVWFASVWWRVFPQVKVGFSEQVVLDLTCHQQNITAIFCIIVLCAPFL